MTAVTPGSMSNGSSVSLNAQQAGTGTLKRQNSKQKQAPPPPSNLKQQPTPGNSKHQVQSKQPTPAQSNPINQPSSPKQAKCSSSKQQAQPSSPRNSLSAIGTPAPPASKPLEVPDKIPARHTALEEEAPPLPASPPKSFFQRLFQR